MIYSGIQELHLLKLLYPILCGVGYSEHNIEGVQGHPPYREAHLAVQV